MKKLMLCVLVSLLFTFSNYCRANHADSSADQMLKESATKFQSFQNSILNGLQKPLLSINNYPFTELQTKEEEDKFNKSLYLTSGLYSYGVWDNSINLNFPVFKKFKRKGVFNFGATLGYLYSLGTDEVGFRTSAHLNFLTGRGANHFESGFGLSVFDMLPEEEEELSLKTVPYIALGYRYQKPSKSFVFRVGMGVPSIFYISIGKTI